MRKFKWVAFTVLFLIIGVPNADADSYVDGTINFTVTGGNIPAAPTGSFIYDNTTKQFTSFDIFWFVPGGEIGFGVTACIGNTGAGQVVCDGFTDSQTLYVAVNTCNSACGWAGGIFDDDAFFDIGGVQITDLGRASATGLFAFGTFAVSTPEPGTFGLMLLGVGLVFVMRKRIGQRLPQAS